MQINDIKHIAAYGDMYPQEPATAEQISAFEDENGIELPAQYKELLLFSDGGEWYRPPGIQFYGVKHNPVINVRDDDRPDNAYLVIGTLANGDQVLCKQNEERIYIYNKEAGTIEDDEIYEDFFAFLCDLPNILGINDDYEDFV